MWTFLRQQQQRGAQLHAQGDKSRQAGEAPDDATRDREAQQHDRAGDQQQPGDYPATPVENREGDITPSAPEGEVRWDEVVQPERPDERAADDEAGDEDFDTQPLPQGK